MGPPQKKRKQEEENNDQGRNKQDEGTNTPITRECRLLQLPRELRDNVYTFLWTSTRVTFGQRCRGRIGTGRIERKNMKPAPNSLALLRVCRQTFEENKSLWLGRVLFNFEGVRSLLDKLSLLPSTKLSQIRYVCTRGYALKPSYGEYNFYCRVSLNFPLVLRYLSIPALVSLSSELSQEFGCSSPQSSFETHNNLSLACMGTQVTSWLAPGHAYRSGIIRRFQRL